MRLSRFPLSTLKETPADAEIVSHQLMLRAGMIRKLAAGLYNWLPLGLRVLRKVEAIVREEMDRAGALEVLMPAVQPAELWQESGRWEQYGPELLRLKDRHGRDFCFGPTHEEVITDLAAARTEELQAAAGQLLPDPDQVPRRDPAPFRRDAGARIPDEGCLLLSCRPGDSLQRTYDSHVRQPTHASSPAWVWISGRCWPTPAAIGGSCSHEFHVLADSGEDAIAFSDGQRLRRQRGDGRSAGAAGRPPGPRAAHRTGGHTRPAHDRGGQRLSEQLSPQQTASRPCSCRVRMAASWPCVCAAIMSSTRSRPRNCPRWPPPGLRQPTSRFARWPAAPAGSLGPVGLAIPVIADRAAARLADFVCGANRDGFHLTGVNWGRDLPEPQVGGSAQRGRRATPARTARAR